MVVHIGRARTEGARSVTLYSGNNRGRAFYCNRNGVHLLSLTVQRWNPDKGASTFWGWYLHPNRPSKDWKSGPDPQFQRITISGSSHKQKGEIGVMGASMASWMNFSNRWFCYKRSSSDDIASRNPSRRLTNSVMCWHRHSNSPALSHGKGMLNKLPALNEHIWTIHRTMESGPSSVIRASGGDSPMSPQWPCTIDPMF